MVNRRPRGVDHGTGQTSGEEVVVDILAVPHLVAQDTPGHDGQSPRRLRKVTFVRNADQPIVEAEREDDLGRAGEQRTYLALIGGTPPRSLRPCEGSTRSAGARSSGAHSRS